jgi:hypothetical protein
MTDGTPTYMGAGDPAGKYSDYYPEWVDNLADDVTIEGSLLDGAAEGPEAVRTIVGTIRTLYEHQGFNFADNDWLEDYTAQVNGEPIAVSSWSAAMPKGKPSTSRRTTGHAARCSFCPARWARSSRAPRTPSTSSPVSHDADVAALGRHFRRT